MNIFYCVCIPALFFVTTAFFPHPVIKIGVEAGDSITHSEMAQLGFIRSLTRYFIDTQSKSDSNTSKYEGQHTIDELYQIAHPDWTADQVKLYSHPLKSIVDLIQLRNALMDANPLTKNLPTAHFDSESFVESNRRLIQVRKKIVEDANTPNKDLDKARGKIGDLLHTLQDFYSHSNWIEMGQTVVNDRISIQEDIGKVAGADQATCTSDGCVKVQSNCNIIEEYIIKSCPLQYYDCKNNIISDINQQGLLTSGYVSNQFNDKNEPVVKPTNVGKCSHGSVLDESANQPPIGGINKDSMTPIYSPHYHLHFEAAKLAIDATERFFNDLRKDIGDTSFDRLFAINPTKEQIQKATVSIAQRKQFHFLTPTLSIGLSSSDLNFKKTVKQRFQAILSTLFGIKDSNAPTYKFGDIAIDKSDASIHASPLVISRSKTVRKRRIGRHRY